MTNITNINHQQIVIIIEFQQEIKTKSTTPISSEKLNKKYELLNLNGVD